MKIENEDVKQKLLSRLSRVEGQIRGVKGMLAEERDCREIMQQLAAIHSAVQSASRVFLREYATVCLMDPDDEPAGVGGSNSRRKREQMIEDMIALFDKTP